MKKLLANFLSAALMLSIASATTKGQNSGNSHFDIPYSTDMMRTNLEKCVDYLNEHDIRVNNLKVLLNAYASTTMSKTEQARYAGWKSELEAYEKADPFGLTKRHKLCMAVETARMGLPVPSSPTPTPSPVTTTGSSSPSNEPPVTDQEIKEVKSSIEKLTPLEDAINEFVKKRKLELPAAPRPEGLKFETDLQPGLQTAKFEMSAGSITVYLPNDIRAGDTISGTVVETPNGRDDKERANNLEQLREFSIELSYGVSIIPTVNDSKNSTRFLTVTRHRTRGNEAPTCNLVAKSGADITKVPIIVDPQPPVLDNQPIINRPFPSIGQTGRTIEIPGKFDGSFNTTKVKFGEQPVIPLAETPRGIVVRCPTNVTGPIDVTIDENGQVTKGTFRNVGIGLSAPKTNLMKGEKTTLTVQVTGLAGIRSDVPLQLIQTGTVTMGGGDTQHIRIRPQDVRADGTYSLTREITGVQPGGFNVTATVFDPRLRPIVIPLIQGARVNGYEVKIENGRPTLVVGGVIDPLTGKPLDGTHRLEAGCGNPVLAKIPYIARLFKRGDARFENTECLAFITPRIIVE